MFLSALAAKTEFQHLSQNLNMLVPQGGQPERAVLFRIFFVANSDVGGFKKLYHSGENLPLGQTSSSQIAAEDAANSREGPPERAHAIEFHEVSDSTISGMIAVLFSASGVAAHSLYVTVGVGTDPNGSPRRRDHQRVYSLYRFGIVDRVVACVQICETASGMAAANARALGMTYRSPAFLADCFSSGTLMIVSVGDPMYLIGCCSQWK